MIIGLFAAPCLGVDIVLPHLGDQDLLEVFPAGVPLRVSRHLKDRLSQPQGQVTMLLLVCPDLRIRPAEKECRET